MKELRRVVENIILMMIAYMLVALIICSGLFFIFHMDKLGSSVKLQLEVIEK